MKTIQSKSLTIAYIGGGSRAWAWTFMTDLALDPELSGVVRLYDIDQSAAEHNAIIGNKLAELPETQGKWRYITAPTLSEALDGADFVVISILPGTFEEMHSDVHLPERLGIYQSVGDTSGPGGTIRALRTIPIFVTFAEAIRDYAPDAWVINYTNPMSVCVRTLYHAFPGIKAFGCCHEVFGTQELLAAMVEQKLGLNQKVNRNEIMVNVLGLNHFTWFDRASYQNFDLFQMYSQFIDTYYEEGFQNEKRNLHNQHFTSKNRVKFDLFRRYGWIAAAGDRHLAEFMPGSLYLKNPEAVKQWGFYLTSVDWRIEDLRQRLQKSEKIMSEGWETPLQSSGEEGILLIKALCGLTRVVSNTNLPNQRGQIANLPKDTVVETNALFSLNSVIPISAGNLSDDIHELIAPHAANQDDMMLAALNCDRDAVYRAFERDPLCAGQSVGDLHKLADDMIQNTMAYLPDGWQ